MAGDPARRRATYDDLVKLPAGKVGEIVAGELFASPRPAAPHAAATSALGVDIGGPFWKGRGGPGGWVILFEPELHLGEDVLVPDIGGWRRERMPEIPDVAAFTLVPDWVCEVLSPSTARLDRVLKTPAYGTQGVRHVWLVDPIAQTLEVLRLEQGRYVLLLTAATDQKVRAEPFDAIELDLAGWWAR
ncbi:MAG: Uma2 family endonuclease [Deltaproteobacteria bacterium]